MGRIMGYLIGSLCVTLLKIDIKLEVVFQSALHADLEIVVGSGQVSTESSTDAFSSINARGCEFHEAGLLFLLRRLQQSDECFFQIGWASSVSERKEVGFLGVCPREVRNKSSEGSSHWRTRDSRRQIRALDSQKKKRKK